MKKIDRRHGFQCDLVVRIDWAKLWNWAEGLMIDDSG